MSEKVFIDPKATTPRELSGVEMMDLSGGGIAVVIWVTSCGEGLGILVAGAIITVAA